MPREYHPIRGRGELAALLGRMEKKLASKVIRTAVRDAAKSVAKDVKARAPVVSGRVKASVKVRAGKRKKNLISSNIEITGGHPDSIIGFVVLGRTGQPPNPFPQRAFEAGKDQARRSIEDRIRQGIADASK